MALEPSDTFSGALQPAPASFRGDASPVNWISQLAPWHPSPTVVVAVAVVGCLYFRGSRQVPVPLVRQLSFWAGLLLIYGALHTRLDYYAEREFFMDRLQQLALHDLGPFLIALSWPGEALLAGVPSRWRERWLFRPARTPVARFTARVLFHPFIAGVVFVGLIWVWLVPVVEFYTMLDLRLYRLMNWSGTMDGLIFWLLTLDPRPSPPARLRHGTRVVLLAVVMPPQVASAALISLAPRNLYPLYELCGRAFSGIDARQDQVLGGLIMWIPGTMMCLAGVLLALSFWFRNAEKDEGKAGPPSDLGKLAGARG